tara:strand:- start:75 stop:314 length:240 start_codon:yes stop_codon:yes gene_type:complete
MARKPTLPKTDRALPQPEFYWTPEQIAAMHQISRAAVFSAIERGDIKGATKPFANVVRIPDSSYRSWLHETTIKQPEDS